MPGIGKLIYHEFMVQNRSNNLVRYSFIFFIFYPLSISFISSQDNITEFGLLCLIISLPLCFINISNNLIKPDMEDGSLEMLLITHLPWQIAAAKYIAVCIAVLAGFFLATPVIYFIFNLDIRTQTLIVAVSFLLITISASLGCLIASMECYFKSNTNLLALIVMPMIIPSIILAGITLGGEDYKGIILIMLGVNLSVIPIFLYFSSYLIENIYNI